jgi:hypothetical protein
LIEQFSVSFVYSLLKDGLHAFLGKKRRLTGSQRVELRQKWKPQFEAKIWDAYRRELRPDVIIRDLRRVDSYPELKEDEKGISPWFRVGLVGTYHRGILVALRWGTLTKHEVGEHWRFTNYRAGERGDLKVVLLGSIPYENIDNVDWDGDEYYGYPHIYCFFAHHKEPYDHTGFYTQTKMPNALPSYHEVVSYRSVRRFSKKLKLDTFW